MDLKRVFAAAVVTTAAAVGLAGAALGAVPGALAGPVGRCTPHSGTIVAVDFAHWGGPVVRGCGVRQRSDYDLLHAAGFTTAPDGQMTAERRHTWNRLLTAVTPPSCSP